MGGQTEKRSSMDGMDGVDHLGGSPGSGVGARHGHPAPQAGGGGYQGTRGVSKFANFAFGDRDPRIDELRTMGLQARWIRIAEAIGVDAFLAMWRILDADPSVRTDKGDLEVTLRPYSSYLRFQRNRYIESLVGQGLGPREIQEAVKRELCEVISLRHISRLAGGA